MVTEIQHGVNRLRDCASFMLLDLKAFSFPFLMIQVP